jgi:hypothetical protein
MNIVIGRSVRQSCVLISNIQGIRKVRYTPEQMNAQCELFFLTLRSGITVPSHQVVTRPGKSARFPKYGVSSPFRKNISLNPPGKSLPETRPSHPRQGRFANVTNARWDAMDATASGAQGIAGRFPVSNRPACGRTALLTVFDETGRIARGPARASARRARTAKLCGPGAPTLVSSLAEMFSPNRVICIIDLQGDGGKKARSPGRARSKP